MSKFYDMRHIEVVLPLVTNAGAASDYNNRFRDLLTQNGVDGWTQSDYSTGVWKGNPEPVTVYTFYVSDIAWLRTMAHLGMWARIAAPDQEAIQVVDHGQVVVHEY